MEPFQVKLQAGLLLHLQLKVSLVQSSEAVFGNGYVVNTQRQVRYGEFALVIGIDFLDGIGLSVSDLHLGARHHCAGCIHNCTHQCRCGILRAQSDKEQCSSERNARGHTPPNDPPIIISLLELE